MFFLAGILLTFFMLLLLPNTIYFGNRKLTTFLIGFYFLMYLSIVQYGLNLEIHLVLPFFVIAPILILYLSLTHMCNQTLGLNEFLKIILFVMIPISLCLLFESNINQFHLVDIVVLALIIITTQSNFIKAPMIYQENLIEFYGLSMTSNLLVLFIFLGYRRINVDLIFIDTIDMWILTLVLSFFCCFSAILIGLKLKYLSFTTEKVCLKNLFILFIFNFFYVAISEEIIYRQLIYNYLKQFLGGGWEPLILTTLLFGCAHISFGGKQMLVLASIAGFFYGLGYILTGNLLAAVIIHTITNVIWRSFFEFHAPSDSRSTNQNC